MKGFSLFRIHAFGCLGVLLIAGLTVLTSCGDLQQKYIHKDRLFHIAYLEDTRAYDVLLVSDEYINNPDPEIRAKSALAIGRSGRKEFSRALIANLVDSSESAAAAKFFAAGLLADSSLFDPIYDLLKQGTPAADRAVEALGRIADSIQAPRIAEFLTDSNPEVVYQTMLAMMRSGGWAEAKRVADIGAATGNRKILYGSLYSLSRGKRSEGKDLFLSLIADSDPEYRMLAYTGLGAIDDTASLKIIATGLNDADNRVVSNAIYALKKFGELGVVLISRKLPEFTDEKLVTLAVESLGEYPNVANSEQLVVNALRKDDRENVKAAAAKALLLIKGQEALYVIDDLIKQPTVHEKTAIADGLTKIEKDPAVARLSQLLNDADPLVRVYALDGLCTIDSNGSARYIQTGLSDSDAVVRATAVDYAAKHGRTDFIPEIEKIYMADPTGLNDDLKRSIIGACETFVKNPQYDSKLMAILQEGCNDSWYLMRETASQILKDKYEIDKTGLIGVGQTTIDKYNYAERFEKFTTNPHAILTTSRGKIEIELLYQAAPKTVNNYIKLAEAGFYDNLIWHRVVPNFVLQDGCPLGTGWGGPGYTIRNEDNMESYSTGAVGMATSGKDTGGSQYFICHSPQPHLDGRYTLFARVISGMDVAREIVRGDTIQSVIIVYDEE